MSFTEPLFICILLPLVLVYYLLPSVLRPYLLFAASLAFCASFGPEHLLFMIAAGIFVWLLSLLIGEKRAGSAGRGRKALLLCAVVCLLLLWIYARHGAAVKEFAAKYGRTIEVLYPLGFSYYTLSLIAYLVDVYRGRVLPVRNPLRFLMFVCYFPKFLQGPIDTVQNLCEQVSRGHRVPYDTAAFGLQLFLYGMFKKLVIAERLSLFLGNIFAADSGAGGAVLLLGLLLRPLELYCDFSGYMDMAEGISELFGIRMAQNFRHPFLSQGIAEFWRRWHISLGAFFRNYVYMPIAVSRRMIRFSTALRKRGMKTVSRLLPSVLSLLVVWFLTGVWHGSEPSYLIWGAYWGILLALSVILAPVFDKMRKALKMDRAPGFLAVFRIVRTYLLFAVGRWITLEHHMEIWQRITKSLRPGELFNYSALFQYGLSERHFRILLLSLPVMCVISCLGERGSVREKVALWPLPVRWILYCGLAFAVLVFGWYGPGYSNEMFIYMRY